MTKDANRPTNVTGWIRYAPIAIATWMWTQAIRVLSYAMGYRNR